MRNWANSGELDLSGRQQEAHGVAHSQSLAETPEKVCMVDFEMVRD
jgi:hypothetical protein